MNKSLTLIMAAAIGLVLVLVLFALMSGSIFVTSNATQEQLGAAGSVIECRLSCDKCCLGGGESSSCTTQVGLAGCSCDC